MVPWHWNRGGGGRMRANKGARWADMSGKGHRVPDGNLNNSSCPLCDTPFSIFLWGVGVETEGGN